MIKLDKTNFWNCLVYKELAYDDSAPEYILQYLRDLNIKLYKCEGETLTSSLLDYPKKEDLGIFGDDNYYQVVHYIGPTQTKIKYRRHRLNEYLRELYSVKTLSISDKWDLIKKPGCLIVSAPHTLVYNDKPYYDSHCINKDVPALISFCKDSNIKTPLMESINNINISRKNNK
jgi:hypothetical protein